VKHDQCEAGCVLISVKMTKSVTAPITINLAAVHMGHKTVQSDFGTRQHQGFCISYEMQITGLSKIMMVKYSMSSPPWAAALTSRRGLIPSEPSLSAERGTGRLSAAQLSGLVWSLADSHRVVRTRLVLGFWGWLMGPHCGLSLRGCFVQPCPFVIPDT